MKVNEYDVPEHLYYNKEHEWMLVEKGNRIKMGITDYAQKMLHEINYVYLPKKGATVKRLDSIAIVESVKSRSELYSPFTGKIVDINTALNTIPGLINEDPYGKGWIIIISSTSIKSELEKVITAEAYAAYIKEMIEIDENLLIYRWRQEPTEP